jgi:hypothetical protein
LLIVLINGKLGVLDKRFFRGIKEVRLGIEFENASLLNDTLQQIKERGWEPNDIVLSKSKTNLTDGIGCDMVLHINRKENIDEVISVLNSMDNIHFAILTHI